MLASPEFTLLNRAQPSASVSSARPSKPPLRVTATSGIGVPDSVMTRTVTAPGHTSGPDEVGGAGPPVVLGVVAPEDPPPQAESPKTMLPSTTPRPRCLIITNSFGSNAARKRVSCTVAYPRPP